MTAYLAADTGSQPSWLLIATLIIGNAGFAGVAITAFFNRRKTQAEASKASSEAGKTEADTTEALVRTSLSLLEPYTKGLKEFSDEASRLRIVNAQLEADQRVVEQENKRLLAAQEALRIANAQLRAQIVSLQEKLAVLDRSVQQSEDGRGDREKGI